MVIQRCPHGIDHQGWCLTCRSEQEAKFLHPSVPRLVTTSQGRCGICHDTIAPATVVARLDGLGWVHPLCAVRELASHSG